MSLDKIGLGKLIELMYASPPRVRKLLRDDIRDAAKKAAGGATSSGGDFYVPFWADAKAHVADASDLRVTSLARVDQNWRRKNLFPKLSAGFLRWWEEKRRYRNEPVTVIPSPTIPPFSVGETAIKIENTLTIEVEGHGQRLLYPYFREEPPLSPEAARIALWALLQAKTGMPPESLRILDVCRGQSFALEDVPLLGDEESVLKSKIDSLKSEREKLVSGGKGDLAA